MPVDVFKPLSDVERQIHAITGLAVPSVDYEVLVLPKKHRLPKRELKPETFKAFFLPEVANK